MSQQKMIKNLERLDARTLCLISCRNEVWCAKKTGGIIIRAASGVYGAVSAIATEMPITALRYVESVYGGKASNSDESTPEIAQNADEVRSSVHNTSQNNLVCAGTSHGRLLIYVLDQKKKDVGAPTTLVGHSGEITDLLHVRSGDHRFLVSSSVDFTLRVWSLDHMQCVAKWAGANSSVPSVECSNIDDIPADKYIWCASDDTKLRVYLMKKDIISQDAENDDELFSKSTENPCIKQWVAHSNGITSMRRDVFGFIWTAGRDRTIRIWNHADPGALVKKIKTQDVPNCIHPAEKHVWVASLCKIRIFDAEKQELLQQVDLKGYVCDMVDVQDTVWVSCSNGSVQVYPHSRVSLRKKKSVSSNLSVSKVGTDSPPPTLRPRLKKEPSVSGTPLTPRGVRSTNAPMTPRTRSTTALSVDAHGTTPRRAAVEVKEKPASIAQTSLRSVHGDIESAPIIPTALPPADASTQTTEEYTSPALLEDKEKLISVQKLVIDKLQAQLQELTTRVSEVGSANKELEEQVLELNRLAESEPVAAATQSEWEHKFRALETAKHDLEKQIITMQVEHSNVLHGKEVEIEALNAQVTTHRVEQQQILESLRQAQEHVQTLEHQVESHHETSLSEDAATLSPAQPELEHKEFTHLVEQAQLLTTEKEQLSVEIRALQLEVERLCEENKLLSVRQETSASTEFSDEKKRMEERIQELQAEVESTAKVTEETQVALRVEQELKMIAEQQITVVSAEKDELSQKLSVALIDSITLKKENSTLSREIRALRETMTASQQDAASILSQEKAHFEDRIRELETSVEKSVFELKKRSDELRIMEEQSKEANKQVITLQSELRSFLKEREHLQTSLNKQIETNTQMQNATHSQHREHEKEIIELKKQLDSLESQLSSRTTEYVTLQEQHSLLVGKHNELQSAFEQQSKDIAQSKEEHYQAHTEFTLKISTLEETIASLKQSSSERIQILETQISESTTTITHLQQTIQQKELEFENSDTFLQQKKQEFEALELELYNRELSLIEERGKLRALDEDVARREAEIVDREEKLDNENAFLAQQTQQFIHEKKEIIASFEERDSQLTEGEESLKQKETSLASLDQQLQALKTELEEKRAAFEAEYETKTTAFEQEMQQKNLEFETKHKDYVAQMEKYESEKSEFAQSKSQYEQREKQLTSMLDKERERTQHAEDVVESLQQQMREAEDKYIATILELKQKLGETLNQSNTLETEKHVLVQGWMFKESNYLKQWNWRYIKVRANGTMSHGKSERTKDVLKEYNLKGALFCENQRRSKPNCLQITLLNGKIVYLSTKNRAEMLRYVKPLENVGATLVQPILKKGTRLVPFGKKSGEAVGDADSVSSSTSEPGAPKRTSQTQQQNHQPAETETPQQQPETPPTSDGESPSTTTPAS